MARRNCFVEDCEEFTPRTNSWLCIGHSESLSVCTRCETLKPHDEFKTRKVEGVTHLTTRCKPCLEWAKDNRRVIEKPPKGFKVCPTCNLLKPLDEANFYFKTNGKPYTYCKPCSRRRKTEWVSALDEDQKAVFLMRKKESYHKYPLASKGRNLRKYNLTIDKYERMYESQLGRCMICEKPESARRNGVVLDLAVDHDHSCCPVKGESCGRCIRGLLCSRCNQGLGYFEDDPDQLTRAISYLQRPRIEVV